MEQTEKLPLRPGFYWVRLFGTHWSIAQYAFDAHSQQYVWYMTAHSVPFCYADFEEVGEEVLPQHYDLQSTEVAEQLGKQVFKQYDKEALLQKVSVLIFVLIFTMQLIIIIKLYR